MGLAEKIAGAKKSNWLTEGLKEAEVKTSIELAKISARIERSRLKMGMTQAEFSEYIGVSQGMVSKWESGEYNFTIKTLNEICQKLNLNLSVSVEKHCAKLERIGAKIDALEASVPTKSALDNIHNVVAENAYNKGYDAGYKEGYKQGKKDAAVSANMLAQCLTAKFDDVLSVADVLEELEILKTVAKGK